MTFDDIMSRVFAGIRELRLERREPSEIRLGEQAWCALLVDARSRDWVAPSLTEAQPAAKLFGVPIRVVSGLPNVVSVR